MLLYNGETLQRFKTEADAFFLENRLYHGAVLDDSTFALATLSGGLAIIDKHGHLRQILNKISGLRDEDLRFLFRDREGALWLASNSGLSRVETPAPLSLFSEPLGINGTVEATTRHQGRLYATTSQGISFLSSSTPQGKFLPVSGIATETWGLLSTDETLSAATRSGIFQIDGERATRKVSDLFTYCLYRSRRDSTRVYAGLNDGLALLQGQNGNWRFVGRIPGISREVRSMVEDDDGVLWLGTSQQGVLRVKVSQPDLARDNEAPAVEIERYAEKDGVPQGWVDVSFVKKTSSFFYDEGHATF